MAADQQDAPQPTSSPTGRSPERMRHFSATPRETAYTPTYTRLVRREIALSAPL